MKQLFTKEGRALPEIPWNRYPRPQLQRENWLCLNGEWSFQAGNDPAMPIRVPFCPESLLSGIPKPPAIGEKLLYRRFFCLPDSWSGKRILLHFGAVSRQCTVRLNGKEICSHDNGYLPFSADISDALHPGENELEVSALNDLSLQYPYGKQSRKRGGMWYTPCSGIWQTVWLEPVPSHYIHRLRIRTETDHVEIEADGIQDGTVNLGGSSYPLQNGKASITINDPHLWTPEDPYLYSFTLHSDEDSVSSYFAFRTFRSEVINGIPRLCLNGQPYFFNGLLDQGYWSDGLYTPASPACFEKDILAMKALGFNTLRKHIKIEPDLFYYDCDRLGMIVFQDMVNNGEYRYVRDTLLPNLGFRKRKDLRMNNDPVRRSVFLDAVKNTMEHLGNHPCIALWTIFNEGWGQFCSDDCYHLLKSLDPNRLISSTSGWFHQRFSDVDSLHIYFQKLHLGREKRPQLISEFGGYVWKDPEHSYNPAKTYGYRSFRDREHFVAGLRRLYGEEVLPLIPKGLCGTVYTQLSDVEDETNGLFTFDREVLKLRSEEIRDLAEKMQQAVRN